MYYYILESPPSRAVRQTYQKLRDILTNLGIAGEMVAASPARSADELTAMGLEKGYSTIVAVGADSFVNDVARCVGSNAVLGVVPINASSRLTTLVGVNSLKDAAEALRHRRWSELSTVRVEPDTTVFLDAVIQPPRMAKVNLIIDNRLRAYAYFNKLTITRALEIRLESSYQTERHLVWGIFKTGGELIRSESLFHGRSARLTTEPELPLTVEGVGIARTPLALKLVPNSLKVITKRGTLS